MNGKIIKQVLKILLIYIIVFGIVFNANGESFDKVQSSNYYSQELGEFGTGSEMVGKSGNASYSYPLGEASLVYSSQGGWQVAGFSVITRSTKWGVPGYKTSPEDIFTLDGVELSTSAQGFYHTVNENYNKIQYISKNTADSYWKVTKKDGTQLFYGHNANSRIDRYGKTNDTQPRCWVLNEVKDVRGNTVKKYEYIRNTDDAGFYLHKVISRKPNASSTGWTATILYYYQVVSKKISYREGTKVFYDRVLRSVKNVIGCDQNANGGNIINAFGFEYIKRSGNYQIKSIVPFGPEVDFNDIGAITNIVFNDDGTISEITGSHLPLTTFDYSDVNPGFAEVVWANSGNEYIRSTWSEPDFKEALREADIWDDNNVEMYTNLDLRDMNGDGLPDKVRNVNNEYLEVALNTGVSDTGFSPATRWVDGYCKVSQSKYERHFDATDYFGPLNVFPGRPRAWDIYKYQVGYSDMIDINGDGKADGIWSNKGVQIVRLSTGTGFSGPLYNWNPPNMDVGWKLLSNTIWEKVGNAYISDVNPFVYEDCKLTVNMAFIQDYKIRIDFIDINGDGLPDRVIEPEGGSGEIYAALNNGNGFEPQDLWGYNNDTELSQFRKDRFVVGYKDNNEPIYTDKDDGGIRKTYTKSYQEMIDINGDGLVDKIYVSSNGTTKISYNNGHGFEPSISNVISYFNYQTPYPSNSVTINTFRMIENDRNNNHTYINGDIQDINGDGLPDLFAISDEGDITVFINYGYYFSTEKSWGMPKYNYLKCSKKEDGFNSRTFIDFIDMNGDGLVDHVKQDGGAMYVALNTATTPSDDMLVKVNNANGGSITYDYSRIDRTKNPNYKVNDWIVSSVTVDDGFSNETTTSYEYHNGYFDTKYRENRGYGKVVKTDPMGNITETYYHQGRNEAEIWKSGLVDKVITKDSYGNIYNYQYNHYSNFKTNSSDYSYQAQAVSRSLAGPNLVTRAPRLVQTDIYIVDGAVSEEDSSGTKPEGSDSDWKRLKIEMEYDDFGNLILEENFGEVDTDGNDIGYDKTKTVITYVSNIETTWEFAVRSKEIFGTNGESTGYSNTVKENYRYSGTTGIGDFNDADYIYDGYLKAVFSELDGVRVYTARYGYDDYGNINIVRDALGNDTIIEYDTKFGVFPIKATNALGHSSYSYYDNHNYEGTDVAAISNNITLGRLTKTRDANDVFSDTYYDVFGREVKQVAPGDTLQYPTVEIEYRDYQGDIDDDGELDADEIAYIKTMAREVSDQVGTIESYSYIDGLGRTIQTITEGEDVDEDSIWLASDAWYYIENNESVQELSSPHTVSGTSFSRSVSPTGETTVSKSYLDSSKGAVTETIAFNDEDTEYTYKHQFTTISRDANNNYNKIITNGLGNVIELIDYTGSYPYGSIYKTNKLYYNTATGALLRGIENAGGETEVEKIYTYDDMGRLLTETDPDRGTTDSGITTYTYDDNSNLLRLTDAKGQTIEYVYDVLGRVIYEKYLDEVKVSYFYDEGGAGSYANGALTHIEDDSGSTWFYYDERGRLISEEKTINGLSGARTTSYEYDAMNRITHITYPDGEVVKHTYNGSGNLEKLGVGGQENKYIEDIDYNEFGQETLRLFGNGASNIYEYYGADGNYRMSRVTVAQSDSLELMNYAYTYDAVGNIIGIDAANDMFDQNFEYDHQYRLIRQANRDFAGDSSSYEYDQLDNITDKNGVMYYYDSLKPHAVTNTTAHRYYEYDANGNMIKNETDMPEVEDVPWFTANPGNGKILLKWENPKDDFFGVKILRREGIEPTGPNDSNSEVVTILYGTEYVIDTGLTNGTTYFYTAYCFNRYKKYSKNGKKTSATPSETGWTTIPIEGVVSAASVGGLPSPIENDPDFKSFYKIYNYDNPSSGLFYPCNDFSDQAGDFTLKSVIFPTSLDIKSEIISQRSNSSSNNYTYSLYLNGDNQLCFDFEIAGVAERYIADLVFEQEQFYFIFVVYDSSVTGNDKIKIYINGNLTSCIVNQIGSISFDNLNTVWMLNKGYNLKFNGIIDEVSIYERIFNAEEIAEYYNEFNQGRKSYSYAYDYKDRLVSVSEILSEKTPGYNDSTLGLAVKWSMDENIGETIADSSGNGNDGIINGASWTTGVSGSALNFNGANDYVGILDIDLGNTLTIEAWIRIDGGFGTFGGIIGSQGWGPGDIHFQINPQYGNKLQFGLFGLQPSSFMHSTTVFDESEYGVWHHVAATYDGNSGVGKVYVDGQLQETTTGLNNVQARLYNPRIGSTYDNGRWFNGLIDELTIYDKALTEEEIQNRYNDSESELLAKWSMDENTGETVIDSSGNGNDGTINGATWTDGKSGNALSFEWSSQDNVKIDYQESQIATDELTLEVWIYPTAWDNIYAGYNRIISKQPVYLLRGANGSAHFQILTQNHGYQGVYSGYLELNQWHHIVGTFDGRNIKLYVDNVLAGTNQLPAADSIATNEAPIYIGESPVLNEGFTGKIDEAAIYDRALTDAEIMDHFNNPAGGSNVSTYTYDYAGKRVKKVEYGITNYYFNDYYEVEDNDIEQTPVKYYYANSQMIAHNKNGELSFYHQDHLGSSSVITNSSGIKSNRLAYMPYGELAYIENFEGDIKRYFTGQEMDLSGLYYYGARYYDPELGRFITLDPMGDDYCYCYNNPVMYVDPSGMSADMPLGPAYGEGYNPGDPVGWGSGDDEFGSYSYWYAGSDYGYNYTGYNDSSWQTIGSSVGGFWDNSNWALDSLKAGNSWLYNNRYNLAGIGVGFLPAAGEYQDFMEYYTGRNYFTGEELSWGQRTAAGISIFLPVVSGALLRTIRKTGIKLMRWGIGRSSKNKEYYISLMSCGPRDSRIAKFAVDVKTGQVAFGPSHDYARGELRYGHLGRRIIYGSYIKRRGQPFTLEDIDSFRWGTEIPSHIRNKFEEILHKKFPLRYF